MEQSEGFKRAEAKVKELEQRLYLCDGTLKQCEQSGKDAEKEIEEHFAGCVNALAARKAVLLREVAIQIADQKKRIEGSRAALDGAFEGCKLSLKTGSLAYSSNRSTAENIWKEVVDVPLAPISDFRVKVTLANSFLDSVQRHGIVLDCSRFSQADMITTLAGSQSGSVDGQGVNAKFQRPFGSCVSNESLYITDSGNRSIRKITLQGDVSTFVAPNAGLIDPRGIVARHKDDSFFVYDHGTHAISHVTSSGATKVIAGSGKQANGDGIGTSASIYYSPGMAIDQQTGNLFFTDYHAVRKINLQGEVSTLAGSDKSGFAEGNGRNAVFNCPYGICFDSTTQALLVCDHYNKKIRRVLLNGNVSTLCDIESNPLCIAITANDVVLVGTSSKIYKLLKVGDRYKATVLAGAENEPRVEGKPNECSFHSLRGLAVHEQSHSVFVIDQGNNAIRKISFINL